MTKPQDDLEAVRIITDALSAFDAKEQERIIRWARERLGLSVTAMQTPPAPVAPSTHQSANPAAATPSHQSNSSPKDIKTFIDEKQPSSNSELTAAVAYYYRFEAPPENRKDAITSEDLQEACRLAKRDRMHVPSKTLANAHAAGLLNKGSERGTYSINTVGENLVAMTLPSSGGSSTTVKRTPKKKSAKKATKKKKKA